MVNCLKIVLGYLIKMTILDSNVKNFIQHVQFKIADAIFEGFQTNDRRLFLNNRNRDSLTYSMIIVNIKNEIRDKYDTDQVKKLRKSFGIKL